MIKRKDNKPTNIVTSNPMDLIKNCHETLILMKAAYSKRCFYQVAHMGHIAFELSIKASFSKKYNGEHPYGHSLPDICIYELPSGKSLSEEISSDPNIQDHYMLIKTVWDMHKRYSRAKISRKEAQTQKNSFRELTLWVLKNYC